MSLKQNTLSHRLWRMNRKYIYPNQCRQGGSSGEARNRYNLEYIRGIMGGFAAKRKADLDNEMIKLREQIHVLEKKNTRYKSVVEL